MIIFLKKKKKAIDEKLILSFIAHSASVKFLSGHLPLIEHNTFCYPHAILG